MPDFGVQLRGNTMKGNSLWVNASIALAIVLLIVVYVTSAACCRGPSPYAGPGINIIRQQYTDNTGWIDDREEQQINILKPEEKDAINWVPTYKPEEEEPETEISVGIGTDLD